MTYANWRPCGAGQQDGSMGGGGTAPAGGIQPYGAVQNVTSGGMLKAGLNAMSRIFEAWEPFTSALQRSGARVLKPRDRAEGFASPFDLDGSEAITRFGDNPASGRAFPYPWVTGAVSGFMPMMDLYSMSFAFAKMPSGPGIGTGAPIGLMRITYPELPKVTG